MAVNKAHDPVCAKVKKILKMKPYIKIDDTRCS